MMEITREDRRSVIDHCYLAYFISGMVILIFGVILPNLIEERNLSSDGIRTRRRAVCCRSWRLETYVPAWSTRYFAG